MSGNNVGDLEKCQDSKINTHSLRFKERLLNVIFYLSASHQRRDVFFIADAKMGNVAYQAYEKKENEEAFAMLECCKDVARKSIFTHEAADFDGSFEADYQSIALPSALLLLVLLLLYSPKYAGPITQEPLKI